MNKPIHVVNTGVGLRHNERLTVIFKRSDPDAIQAIEKIANTHSLMSVANAIQCPIQQFDLVEKELSHVSKIRKVNIRMSVKTLHGLTNQSFVFNSIYAKAQTALREALDEVSASTGEDAYAKYVGFNAMYANHIDSGVILCTKFNFLQLMTVEHHMVSLLSGAPPHMFIRLFNPLDVRKLFPGREVHLHGNFRKTNYSLTKDAF